MTKTILIFAPHPDDAEFYAGGLLALFAREKSRIIIVTATDGRCGSYQQQGDELAQIRGAEAKEAAEILSAEPPIWLGYRDFELDLEKPGEIRRKLIWLIREYKPEVVISEDPYAPDEPHPDHRTLAWAAMEAVSYSSLPAIYPDQLAEGLSIHFVPEKYFYAENNTNANRIVDISNVFETKLAALMAHKSQIEFLVEDFIRQAKIAGMDLNAIPGDIFSDPNQAIRIAMSTSAAEAGKKIGIQYGEPYRYSRFHPYIENVLQARLSGEG